MRSFKRKKALRVCCGAERTEGSGSGACGVVRAAAPFLHDDPVYQQAVDTRASGCIGVGGDARGCVRRCVAACSGFLRFLLLRDRRRPLIFIWFVLRGPHQTEPSFLSMLRAPCQMAPSFAAFVYAALRAVGRPRHRQTKVSKRPCTSVAHFCGHRSRRLGTSVVILVADLSRDWTGPSVVEVDDAARSFSPFDVVFWLFCWRLSSGDCRVGSWTAQGLSWRGRGRTPRGLWLRKRGLAGCTQLDGPGWLSPPQMAKANRGSIRV